MADFTILGKIDLSQFDRKRQRESSCCTTECEQLDKAEQHKESPLTKDQEIQEAYREYHEQAELEWRQYVARVEAEQDAEMLEKEERELAEEERLEELWSNQEDEEWMRQQQEEEREERMCRRGERNSSYDAESEIMSALISGYGDLVGFD